MIFLLRPDLYIIYTNIFLQVISLALHCVFFSFIWGKTNKIYCTVKIVIFCRKQYSKRKNLYKSFFLGKKNRAYIQYQIKLFCWYYISIEYTKRHCILTKQKFSLSSLEKERNNNKKV